MIYRDINDYELLDMKENEEAREILYKKYKPLIYKIANSMYQTNKIKGVELSDFIQEGNIGFTHAMQTYKEDKNSLFFTYAKSCIEKSIISFIVKNNRQKNKILNESLSMEMLEENKAITSFDRAVMDKSLDPFNIIANNKDSFYDLLKPKLTDFEITVLELRDYGLDYKEIASLLDRDAKSIDNALQRIKNKAKKISENT